MEGAIQAKRHRNANENEQNGEDEGIELNLGLSMNGRFGVDPLRKKLKRSSTVSNLVFAVGGGGGGDGDDTSHARGAAFESHAPLIRTRSLPTETEEEWRRRKEVESMRRMEARKKRMEKLKCVGVQRVVVSQGSIGSSGSSDLDNQHTDGPKQNSMVISPSNGRSKDQGEQKLAIRAADVNVKGRNESLTSAMMDMPHVTTKEDGPNGHKVEGFLYRYKKGEEVKIVCVCHGMFLSPAEFVKHGGGGDVDQPLKHIVVNPFPIS